jgi:hypothetical protein
MSAQPQVSYTAKGRIRQVFEYLKALNDHRNPAVRQVKEHPWSLWLDQLPDHPFVELPRVTTMRGDETEETDTAFSPPYLLRVRRPKLTLPPTLPAELKDWLYAGWDDPRKEAKPYPTRNQVDPDGETVTVGFQDDPARPTALSQWLPKRAKWQAAENPARDAMAVFERLYALHGKLERESESFDLVAADGLLSWKQPDGNIYHPVLIQRVQLEFDS